MAFTVTNEAMHVFGDLRIVLCTATFPASYNAGGESVAASVFQHLSEVVFVQVGSPDDAKFRATWDRSNEKVKLYEEDGTTGIEAEATGDQSGVVVELFVLGK